MLRAQSYYLVDDYKSTAKVLDSELDRTVAASKKPPELLLKLLVDSKERLSDMDGAKKAQQLLAQYYPGK
jgi:TolA-binding protein